MDLPLQAQLLLYVFLHGGLSAYLLVKYVGIYGPIFVDDGGDKSDNTVPEGEAREAVGSFVCVTSGLLFRLVLAPVEFVTVVEEELVR